MRGYCGVYIYLYGSFNEYSQVRECRYWHILIAIMDSYSISRGSDFPFSRKADAICGIFRCNGLFYPPYIFPPVKIN